MIDVLMNKTNADVGLILLKKPRRTHPFNVSFIRPEAPIGDRSRFYGAMGRNVLAKNPVRDVEVEKVFLSSIS